MCLQPAPEGLCYVTCVSLYIDLLKTEKDLLVRLLFCLDLIYMDTDLLDFSSDVAADDGQLYGEMTELSRRTVPSFGAAPVASIKRNANAEKVEASKSDPATSWSSSVQPECYQSPGSVADGGVLPPSSPAVHKPDLPPKTPVVPAVPPRKPRPPTVPTRPEAVASSKATQAQPPLPHHVAAPARKSIGNSFANHMYGVTTLESHRVLTKGHSVEADDSPLPVPVPRSPAVGNSLQTAAPPLSNPTPLPYDSPIPCESLSSGEQVSIQLPLVSLQIQLRDISVSVLLTISLKACAPEIRTRNLPRLPTRGNKPRLLQ